MDNRTPLTAEQEAELRALIDLANEDATVGVDRLARLLATLDREREAVAGLREALTATIDRLTAVYLDMPGRQGPRRDASAGEIWRAIADLRAILLATEAATRDHTEVGEEREASKTPLADAAAKGLAGLQARRRATPRPR